MNTGCFQELFLTHIELIPEVTGYLTWYEYFPWKLTCSDFNQKVLHPYIKYAQCNYKIRDGKYVTRQEAEKILDMTRRCYGTELIELAILANLERLQTIPVVEFHKLENFLKTLQTDHEIVKAIEWSRFATFKSRTYQYLDETVAYCDNLSDITVNYTNEYQTRLVTGNFLELDSQARYLVYRTRLPIQYAHIFARHLFLARARTKIDLWVESNLSAT